MRLSRIFLSLVLVVLLFIAFLPSIISTSWGTRQLTSLINHRIPGKIEISKLDVKWGSGQLIEGFVLRDPEGNAAVEFEKLWSEATLWQLIRQSTHLGHTKLHDLNAHVYTDDRGISNLQRAFGIDAQQSLTPIPASTIILSDVEASLNLFTPGEPLAVSLQGRTIKGPLTGSFAIEANLPDMQVDDWSQFGQDAQRFLSIEGSKSATLQAKVENFPVDLIDQLAALKDPELNGIFRTLIGDKINIKLDKESTVEGLAFNLTILAPLLQGDVKGKVINQQITLQEPAVIHLDLKPESVNLFTKKQLALLEPSRLKIIIDELVLPLSFIDSNTPLSACHISFKGHSELQPETKIDVIPLGPLSISTLEMSFESPQCQENIQVIVKGEGKQPGNEPFSIDFETKIKKPTYLHELIANLKEEFQGTLKIGHFPLRWPGLNLQQQENLRLAGEFVNVDLTFKKQASKELILSVALQSDLLKLAKASFKVENELQSTQPFTIEYTLQPAILERLEALRDYQLNHPTTIAINFKEFNLPLSKPEEKGYFEVKATLAPLEVIQRSSQHVVKVEDFLLQLKGSPLTSIASQLSMKIILPTVSKLLGKETQFSASSNLSIDSAGLMTFSHLEADLKSPQAHVHVAGKLLPNQELILTHPLEVSYKLTPEALREITHLNEDQYPKLHNTPTITFRADPLHLNLAKLQPDTLVLTGNITIDRLMLQDQVGALTTIDQVDVPWEVNGPKNQAFLNLKGMAFSSLQQKPSQLAVQLKIFDWFSQNQCCLDHMKVEVHSHLLGVPTALVTPFIAKEDLSPILGSSLDLELKTFIDRDQKTPGYWDMNINSSNLHAQARLKFDGMIAIYDADENDKNKPMEFRLTLTPEGYQYLQRLAGKGQESTLKAPIEIKGEFTDLYLPLKDKKFSPQQGRIKATIETSDIALKEISADVFKLAAQIDSQNMADQIQFKATLSSNKKESNVTLKGIVANLFDESGLPAFAQSDFNGELQIHQFPVSFLMMDASTQKRLQALLGKEIDAQLTVQLHKMNGQLAMHLKSPNSESRLDGKIKKGILTLNNPFEWETTLTPELSQAFFSESFPMLSQAVGAEKPLKFSIAQEGFALPLMPFDMKKVNIPKGTISLGKIQFRNQGELKNLLSVLKPIAGDYLTIWFTPLYFNLTNGQLQIKRVDLLVANVYPLAAWGKVDLDPMKVDVVVGVSGQALQYAFNIQGLDSDYMLQIPVKGKKGQVELDKAQAVARISALIAQGQSTKEIKLLGSILDLAVGGLKDGQVPAPTTNPLPWQKEIANAAQPAEASSQEEGKSAKKSRKESKKKKESDSLFKGLDEEASGLIMDLFNPKH